MDAILQQVAGSEMMSLLDGFSGYNQVFINLKAAIKPPSWHDGENMHTTACPLVL